MKLFAQLTIRKLWFFFMLFQKLLWLINSNLSRTLKKENIEIHFKIAATIYGFYYNI